MPYDLACDAIAETKEALVPALMLSNLMLGRTQGRQVNCLSPAAGGGSHDKLCKITPTGNIVLLCNNGWNHCYQEFPTHREAKEKQPG